MMESYTKVVEKSLINYFETLNNYGYYSDTGVDKLLILTYLDELLSDRYIMNMVGSDIDIIKEAMFCIIGSSCVIPYAEFSNQEEDPYISWNPTKWLRDTENSYPRLSEQGYYRAIEKDSIVY